MSIKENVNNIVNKKNKIFNTEDYKYNLFINSTSITSSVKYNEDIKTMLKMIDDGKFELPKNQYWFAPQDDAEGTTNGESFMIINKRYYPYSTCNTLLNEYNSFSGKYDASIKELNGRINGLKAFANGAKTCFNNANTKLEYAKNDSDNIIFKDQKVVKSKINDCIYDCNSTIKKLDYIINNL